MAIKVTGTTVINDSRNIENITTINGTTWATVVANASGDPALNDVTDVTLGTLTTGEVLQYNGSAWVNTGLDFTDIASTLADAQVTASNVTQHEASISITESQISDLSAYLTSVPAQSFTSLTGKPTTLFGYGITDAATSSQGALADSALQSYTVTEGDVTGHQAALSITESQISDLGTYETADATILKDADIGVTVLGYDANVVSDATYVATDENFTTADHSKLDGIEASATADQTGAEIKALYEAEANAYTDALNTKLSGIETSATADQTGSEIKALYEAEANAYTDALNTKLAGIETGATADQTKADIEALGILFSSLTSTPSTIAGYGISDAYTTTQVDGAIDAALADLIDSAPTALDTLNELAASLGDDSDFAGTMTTNLATKLNKSGGALTGAVTTTSTFDGRNVSVDGTKLDTIATNADVTPSWVPSSDPSYLTSYSVTTGDVTAAGALMDSEVTNLADVKAFDPADYATASQGTTADQCMQALADDLGPTLGANLTTGSFTVDGRDVSADGTKLDGIAAGATNVTNNNQLTNGAGYITSFTNTTYSGGDGITLSGTTFNIDDDLRGHVSQIGVDTNDYLVVGATSIDFALDGNIDMRLENDGDLHVDGNVVAYSTTISDERLKKDIVKIDNAMDKVSQLSGYTFEYLADGKKSAGVIAQEVEKVLPSAIVENKLPLKMGDDNETMYKTVQYDQLTGLLIEAIKELKAEIEILKG